jgi:CRP/FNR family transcriptional regulator, cyclic AMP receptor protein
MPDSFARNLRKPISKGQTVSFPAGANLFDLDHLPRRMYLLNAGQVRLAGSNGVIFDHLKRGCFFGEKALLESEPGKYAATALSPVEAIAFRKSDLLGEWRRNPNFALRLVKDLALRLARYEELISDLVSEKTEIRLARVLLRAAPARPGSGWVRLPFRFTNVELAQMVGSTRWRISHLLNRFQRLGWLRREQGLWIEREGILLYLAQ